MALSYKARRRWALVILLVGLPLYLVIAVTVLALWEEPSFWLQLIVYLVLGLIWIVPFKSVFKGIGQADPDATDDQK